MLLGIYLSMKIAARKASLQEAVPRRRLVVFSTVMGILFRVGIMVVLAYVLFRYPIVGFSLTEPIILTIIPLIAIYDATLPLYTVPIGYLIARTVGKNLRVGSQDPNVTLTVKG
jgi:hypothetical protein